MNLRELEYVIALGEEKNLTRAAERVSVTPSALTQKLSQLESDAGIELFQRSRKGFEPTEAGLKYIEASKQILQIKKDLYNELHDMAGHYGSILNVGIFPERGSDIFSSIYPDFISSFPDICVNLTEASVYAQQHMISSGELNIGFMSLTSEQRSADDYTLLYREEILIAIPEDYPLDSSEKYDPASRFPVISLRDLRYEPFALMSSQSTFRGLQERIFRENDMSPRILFESARQNSILDMVSCKLCCALISEHYVTSPHAGNVRFFSMPEHPCWDICACHKKGSYLSAPEKKLISLFSDHLNLKDKPRI